MSIPGPLIASNITAEEYWRMIDTLTAGSFYFDALKDTVQWSPKLHKTLGHTEEGEAALSDIEDLVHPEDVEKHRAVVGASQETGHYTTDIRLRNAQNRYQLFRVQGCWFTRGEGPPSHLLGYLEDLSELAASREKAARSERIFEAFCDNAPAAFYIVDSEDRYIYGNEMAAKIMGCTREELVAKTYWDVFDDDTIAEIEESDRRLFEEGSVTRHGAMISRSGASHYVFDKSFVIDGLAGDELLFGGVALDTTKQHEAEKALARSRRLEALGQLVGGIAHDFNNTLAVLKGNLDLAQLSGKAVDIQTCFDEMDAAIERGRVLTLQLLAFGRKAVLCPAVHNLATIAAESERMLSRVLPATISIDVVSEGGLWNTRIDRVQVDNAILNLALNARDSMPDGGRLTLETRNVRITGEKSGNPNEDIRPGDYVLLEMTDTGTGMADEVLERAFEPFFTTKSVDKGSGMGLAMVHGLMSQIDGAARICSEPGTGTTVKLYFPAASLTTGGTDDAERSTGSDVAHVLLAEDEDSVRLVLQRQLEMLGYRVTAAPDGDQAYEVLLSDPSVEFLVTDVVMPGTLQGPMLARRAREHRPALPVLFMSGYPRDEVILNNALRAEDVSLMKPVALGDLAAALTELLGLD